MLGWFGHVERMDEYRLARRVLMVEICKGRVRGKPRLGWTVFVKVALGYRIDGGGCTQCAKDRIE